MAVQRADITAVRHTQNDDGTRDYTVTYQVETNDSTDGPIAAKRATPRRFSVFTYGADIDVGAVLKRKEVELLSEQSSYKHWVVTCQYDSRFDSEDDQDEVDDPLLKPVTWAGSFVQFTRDIQKDKDGTTIKNSAGDPFVDPPITADDSRMSIIATKNFGSLNVNVWASFRDAVNDGTWWGLGARKIKVQSITWDQQFFQNEPFYAVRYEFHINDNTWDEEVLQAGFYERVSGKRQRITDKLGRDINQPWPLTTAGVRLTEAQIDGGNEAYLTVKKYTEKDFSDLGLPSELGAS